MSKFNNHYNNMIANDQFSPVFIVGCGRSGTSIFGKILSQHKGIIYLNEPRELWALGYPETNIWTNQTSNKMGKLYMSQEDELPAKSDIIRRLFIEEQRNNKHTLVEKLPINAFRLGFIDKVFPNARYIHIYRNGLEVARSIEERCINGRWFGVGKYKLQQLVQYAKQKPNTEHIPLLCNDFFEKGLMEWRLSVESIVSFLSAVSIQRYLEFSYQSLTHNPSEIICKVLSFLKLPVDKEVIEYANINVKRNKRIVDNLKDIEKKITIGGPLLPYSMSPEIDDGLAKFANEII